MELTKVTLVVRDYDEATAWYVSRLGFVVREDVPMPDQGKRWVVIGPPDRKSTRLNSSHRT